MMSAPTDEISETLLIGGMSCAACAARIEKSLRTLPGVTHAAVNFGSSQASIRFLKSATSRKFIDSRISELGFSIIEARHERSAATRSTRSELRIALLSAILAAPVAFLGMSHGTLAAIPHSISVYTQFTLTSVLMFLAVREFGTRAFRAALHANADMNTLVFLGVAAAYGTSAVAMFNTSKHASIDVYFEAAAVTTAFVLIGRAIESRARRSTSVAVRELLEAAPKTARITASGLVVDAVELEVGSVVTVLKGERFPADCEVSAGLAIVDESAFTGESELMERDVGAVVPGGCINRGDRVDARVIRKAADSYIPRIAAAIAKLQSGKAPIARIADRVSLWLTPTVLAIAVATFIIWLVWGGADWRSAANFAASVLVVACPCSLGLATPAAIATAAGTFAKQGILFRDPSSIETCARVTSVMFDKTGTLTTGRPRVTSIDIVSPTDREKVIAIITQASRASTHPLAVAVQSATEHAPPQGHWTEIPGRGMSGSVLGSQVLFGSPSLLDDHGIARAELSHDGPALLLAVDRTHVATILFEEQIRSSATEALQQLERLEIQTSIMSGDRQHSVERIASLVQCRSAYAGMSPESKVAAIEQQRRNGIVAFVGDGMNDSPALAAADLGVSLEGATSAAIESAGMTLTNADLALVPAAISFARRTMRTIRFNLFWAFSYNAIALPLASGLFVPINGWKLNPMIASAAMALSSISVLLNSLRLRKF